MINQENLKIDLDLDSLKSIASQVSVIPDFQKLIQQQLLLPSKIMNEYVVSLSESIKALVDTKKFISSWVDSYRTISADFNKLFEEVRYKYKLAEEDVLPCLLKYKWIITPSMPSSFIFQLHKVAIGKGNKRKEMNKTFFDFLFANNFEGLDIFTDRWRSKMNKRRFKILKDNFEILKENIKRKDINVANVVVPALIVQTDGIILDFLKDNGLSIGKYELRMKDLKSNRRRMLPPKYEILLENVLYGKLFQEAKPGFPLADPFQFNRHKILHSENINYGRKEYIVRLVLILDYLAHLKVKGTKSI